MSRRSVLLPPRGGVEPLTEKQWQANVTELAEFCGWEHYHAWLSIHSPTGWPDLALVKPPRLIFAELKSESGKATPNQEHWLSLLRRIPGIEVYLWRPADVDSVIHILTGR